MPAPQSWSSSGLSQEWEWHPGACRACHAPAPGGLGAALAVVCYSCGETSDPGPKTRPLQPTSLFGLARAPTPDRRTQNQAYGERNTHDA